MEGVHYLHFDHPHVIQHESEDYDGEHGPGAVIYAAASAPTVAAFATRIEISLLRNKGRRVVVYWRNGKKRLSMTGDLSTEEIEALMRAQIEKHELEQAPGDNSID
jgi:hypothetical protein